MQIRSGPRDTDVAEHKEDLSRSLLDVDSKPETQVQGAPQIVLNEHLEAEPVAVRRFEPIAHQNDTSPAEQQAVVEKSGAVPEAPLDPFIGREDRSFVQEAPNGIAGEKTPSDVITVSEGTKTENPSFDNAIVTSPVGHSGNLNDLSIKTSICKLDDIELVWHLCSCSYDAIIIILGMCALDVPGRQERIRQTVQEAGAGWMSFSILDVYQELYPFSRQSSRLAGVGRYRPAYINSFPITARISKMQSPPPFSQRYRLFLILFSTQAGKKRVVACLTGVPLARRNNLCACIPPPSSISTTS